MVFFSCDLPKSDQSFINTVAPQSDTLGVTVELDETSKTITLSRTDEATAAHVVLIFDISQKATLSINDEIISSNQYRFDFSDNDQSYTIIITAENGEESTYTLKSIKVFTPAQFLPVVGLQPMFVTADQIKIAWRSIDASTSSYAVERSVDATMWETLAENLSAETYEDDSLQAGTQYHYRIVSKNAQGETQTSASLKVSTYSLGGGGNGGTGGTGGTYGLTKEYTEPWLGRLNLGYAPAYARLTVETLAPSITDMIWNFGVTKGFTGRPNADAVAYLLSFFDAKESLVNGATSRTLATQQRVDAYSASEYIYWKDFGNQQSGTNILEDDSNVIQSEDLPNFAYRFNLYVNLFFAGVNANFFYSIYTSPLVPPSPSGLGVNYNNGYQLSWTASSLNQRTVYTPYSTNAITVDTDAPSGYVVEYSRDGGESWLSLGVVSAYNAEGEYTQDLSFHDVQKWQGLTYRVKAVNYTGESDYLTE